MIQPAFGVDRKLFAVNTPAKWDKPVTALVNSYSAFCAEFFTINILQVGRGAVIGEPTYGVGNTVVSFSFLSDGSTLQITTAGTVTAENAPYASVHRRLRGYSQYRQRRGARGGARVDELVFERLDSRATTGRPLLTLKSRLSRKITDCETQSGFRGASAVRRAIQICNLDRFERSCRR